MESRLRILARDPRVLAGTRVRRPGRGRAGARLAARRARARRRRPDDDAPRRRRAARATDAGRDGRRRARDVPRDAPAVPLDGHHADAAARAPAARATRRRARRGLSRPRHDGRRRVVPGAPGPVRLRAGRHVQAAPAQGPSQAGVRRDARARRRIGRAARDRLLAARARRRCGMRRRPVARPPPRQRLPGASSARPDGDPLDGRRARRAPRSSSTSAGSPRRRASSTSSRRRGGSPTSTSCSPGRTTVTGRWRRCESALADPRHRGPDPRASADGRAAVRPLPARRRLRPRLGRRELRARRGRGRGRGNPRDRLRPYGVASSFGDGEALVVPYEQEATVEAIGRVLGDDALRRRLSDGALRAAARSTWDAVVDEQLAIYAEALEA